MVQQIQEIMDRRKFFKNLVAGTAAVGVAATIPLSVLKAAEGKVQKVAGDTSQKYMGWNHRLAMNDLIYFKEDFVAVVGSISDFSILSVNEVMAIREETGDLISQISADVDIGLIPLRSDEGPDGEPKGANFERKLSWLKENTIRFCSSRGERDGNGYGHYEEPIDHGW